MNRAWTLVVASLLAAVGGAMFAAVEGAAATTCATMITISASTSQNKLVLTPTAPKVRIGGCVGFTNSSSSRVSVVVNRSGKITYRAKIAKGASISGRAGYAPKAVGNATVTATGSALLVVVGKPTGTATLTVQPAPSSTPSSSASPRPTGKHSGKPGNSPTVAPKPKHSKHHGAGPKPTGIKLPPLPPLPTTGVTSLPRAVNPLVAPGPPSAATVTSSSTPVAAVIGGPLEPTGDNRRGLPEAVGVLVVLGMVTGWGRVLLANPGAVDNRPKGDHRL